MVSSLAYDFFVANKPVVPGVIRDIHAHLVNTVLHLNIFHIAPVIMSIVTLSAILTLTQILRIVVRPIASVEQN